MTIVDFAKETGLSKQAIYQRLKRKNIKLSDIQQPDSNELTQEGLFTLTELFGIKATDNGKAAKPSTAGASVDLEKVNTDNTEERIKQLEEENKQLKATIEELRAAAAAKDQQLIEAYRQQADFAQQIALKRLPGETAPRRTLWERITGRGKHQETPSTESK